MCSLLSQSFLLLLMMDRSAARIDFPDSEMTWSMFLPEFKKLLERVNQLEEKVNILQSHNKVLENQLNSVHLLPSPAAAVAPSGQRPVGISQDSINTFNTGMEQMCERLQFLERAQESHESYRYGRETYGMGNLEPVAEHHWMEDKIITPRLNSTVTVQQSGSTLKGFLPLQSTQSQPEYRTIVLHRDQRSLGFTIVGGYGSPQGEVFPIIVKTICADGVAAEDGRLKPGDQIISVNGESLEAATHDRAVSIFQNATDTITMVVISRYSYTPSAPTEEYPVLQQESGISSINDAAASGIRRRR